MPLGIPLRRTARFRHHHREVATNRDRVMQPRLQQGRLGAAPALSGPIARGDSATVQRQQQAVQSWDAATGELYRALVAPTQDLARRKRGG